MSPRVVFFGVLGFSSLFTLALSGLNRPIWIDEFLHFSLAGQSWSVIWDLIATTSSGVNHGQTWFYQVVSIGLIRAFGPSVIGIRLLSWVATFALILSSYFFLRLFSVSNLPWLAVVGLLAINRYFFFEMGNGRPYMVLVVTTALVAFTLFSNLVETPTRFKSKLLFGLVAIVGALNHPYFPVILVGLVAAFYTVSRLESRRIAMDTTTVMRPYFAFSTVSGLISIAIGSLTWMRGSPNFSGVDPFEPTQNVGLAIGFTEWVVVSVLFVFAAVSGGAWFIWAIRKIPIDLRVSLGLALIVLGLALSLFFTWVSILRSYWIFPRQWLPGAFLVFIGLALLMASILSRVNRQPMRPLGRFAPGIVGVMAVSMILFGAVSQVYTAVETRAWWNSLSPQILQSSNNEGNDFWVLAANLNIKCGGNVWPALAKYYDPGVTPDFVVAELERSARNCP